MASDTTGVGTARYGLAAASYGDGKAVFGFGFSTQNDNFSNLVSNTGVVASDTTGVGSDNGTDRSYLAAVNFGGNYARAIFCFGYANGTMYNKTNFVNDTGVIVSDTYPTTGTARYGLAAAGYSLTA